MTRHPLGPVERNAEEWSRAKAIHSAEPATLDQRDVGSRCRMLQRQTQMRGLVRLFLAVRLLGPFPSAWVQYPSQARLGRNPLCLLLMDGAGSISTVDQKSAVSIFRRSREDQGAGSDGVTST